MMKKTSATKNRSVLKKKCDVVFSKIVRLGGKCERCGRTTSLQCAHIISRSRLNLRWDLWNALCLCYGCHLQFWHRSPLEAITWFQEKYPERFEYLMKKKNVLLTDRVDYEDLYKKLVVLWAEMSK